MAACCDRKTYNVVVHGICFMLIFTAVSNEWECTGRTTAIAETHVLNSIKNSDGTKKFDNFGYISLAIIYTVFSLSNFIAPPIVNLIGPRAAMFVGGICYALFIGAIIYPLHATLYIASIVVGVGAALIWTGQGNFLTINSTGETMGRNSGIFWALLQCSLLFGNMFVYFYFKGKITIDDHGREVLYTVLLVCAGLGTLMFVLLRKTSQSSPEPVTIATNIVTDYNDDDAENTVSEVKQTPLEAFSLHLTFFSGVYGNSIGNIDPSKLPNATRQIGLMGMFIGAGEISGGLLFGIFGKVTNRYGRDPIVLLGFLVHIITFYLIFLNVPDRAPLSPNVVGDSWLHYNLYVYALSAYLLGFGDSCFNTQMYSILGTIYSKDSAPAFALFKCVQSVAAAIGFVYTQKLVLKYQLLILVVMSFCGTLSFFSVERKHAKLKEAGYEPIA